MMNKHKLSTLILVILILGGVAGAVVVNIDGSGISGVTNQTVNFYSGNYNNLTNVPTNFPNSTLSGYGNNFPNNTVASKEATWDATTSTVNSNLITWNSTYNATYDAKPTNASVNPYSFNASNATGTLPSGSLPTNQRMATLAMVFDGSGSALTIQNANTSIGYSGVIQDIIFTGDVVGNATVIISNASSASNTTYTIRCTVTMTSMQDMDDTTLSGCATNLAAKDRINFNLSAVSTLTKLSVAINILKD